MNNCRKSIQFVNSLFVYLVTIFSISALVGCVPYSKRDYTLEYGYISSAKSSRYLTLVPQPLIYLKARCFSADARPVGLELVAMDISDISFSSQPTVQYKNKIIQASKVERIFYNSGKYRSHQISFDIPCEEFNGAKLDLNSIKIAEKEYSIPSIFFTAGMKSDSGIIWLSPNLGK